ncbi:D-alanyl-D-alanine carboxypeptidase family protein [Streptomyces smyrnaeus]|uniref:D-alanyl-D-alanine carboxypeptidase family protein n=1 Tax=Streptomyces smyrnaeus TaxID=1387713 RepID=UPI000C66448C
MEGLDIPNEPKGLYVRRVPISSHYSDHVARAYPRSASHKRRATTLGGLASTALVLSLLTATGAQPATADDNKPGGKQAEPKPPAQMSTIGGEQLGRPGTQVNPKKGAPELPTKLSGRSWIVTDAESGKVLASHNAHWRLPPASTLKMLFADTVLPKLPKDRTHKVVPSDLEGMGSGSSLVGVKEGETYSVHDLWLGVFLRSGNDAVHVLAAMNGGKEKTVREMNERARTLHANDTKVVSPDGYDHEGQVSSAYDLTLFARSGLQNKDFREYAATATAKFPGETKKDKKTGKTKRESFQIQNTNRLLTGDGGVEPYPGIAGVKNGFTTNAGNTFTGVAQRGDRVLLVTVMHPGAKEAHSVYKEAAKLLDWGFAADGKVEPVGELAAPGNAAAGGGAPAGKGGEAGGSGTHAAAHTSKPSGGAGTALGITAGVLVALALVAYGVHRRWPLPELARRRRR